jgi:hypothetical protein
MCFHVHLEILLFVVCLFLDLLYNNCHQPAERYKLLDRKTEKPLKSGETTHGESRYGPGKQKRYTKKELRNMHENGAKYKQVETGTKKLFSCLVIYTFLLADFLMCCHVHLEILLFVVCLFLDLLYNNCHFLFV